MCAEVNKRISVKSPLQVWFDSFAPLQLVIYSELHITTAVPPDQQWKNNLIVMCPLDKNYTLWKGLLTSQFSRKLRGGCGEPSLFYFTLYRVRENGQSFILVFH